MASTSGVLVDDNVLEVLRKAQLDNFVNIFVFRFQVRRFDHFSHVRDKDMQDIGMQQQQIRQLREQILKMSRELWNRSDPKQVYVQADQSTPVQNSIDEKALIPNEQIKLFEQLGEGSFAVVKRGTWTQSNGQRVDVAVKILRDISPNIMDDLRVEASHLLKLQHPSLIRLYGIVRQPAMMVFELCEGGSLLDRLRDEKKAILLVSRLHDYCMQIAKALQFLESKHCVHRDVAARNILLAKDEKTVKICDFGLMRALKENEQMYTMGPQKKVPFAWCPPEALRHRKFSHASDVWSYGVTVWEVFTFGEEPWVGCRAIDVLKNIDAGERLEKPKYCSERVYQIMQNCWKSNPAERCKFGAIREDLKAAMFLDAVARENYASIQPGTLQLVKGDEVVVVENTGQDWFGQNKKNQKFGTFPRTVVFAQTTNHAVAAATAVTPQKVPTAPTIKVHQQQPPPPMPSFSAKPLNNNSITSVNDRTSKISMPVAGSFIHTGHGDPLGGQSWGNPSNIDMMYLKNPVKGAPLSSASNGAEIITSKAQLTNGGRSTHIPAAPSAAMSKIRGLSLDLPEYDDFDRAFDDGFSPSKIELPRGFGNDSVISNGASRHDDFVTNYFVEASKSKETTFDIRGNVLQPTPVKKVQVPKANNAPRPILVVPSGSGVTSMQLPTDKFTTPQPHGSSRNSTIDHSGYPFTSSAVAPSLDSRNLATNFLPELQTRLNADTGNSMRPRPASSIGLQNIPVDVNRGQVQRPVSVVNVPSTQQNIPCLVPTPAPSSAAPKPVMNQSTQLQKDLANELKGNLSRRPTNGGSTSATQRPISSQPQQVRLPPPAHVAPVTHRASPPLVPTPIAPTPIGPTSNALPTRVNPTSLNAPVRTSPPTVSPTPAASVPAVTAPTTSVPTRVAPATTVAPTTSVPRPTTSTTTAQPPKPATTNSAQNVVTRRPTGTVHMSDEERRSKIIQDVTSALPAPSALLYGSSSASSSVPSGLPSASTAPPTKSQVPPPSQPHVTMPPKKRSEPILSTEVLQPTRLHTASTSVSTSVPQPALAPQRNPSPPVARQQVVPEKKPTLPSQSTNVPLFNITNSSSMYPQLHSYPSYGNGYQPYGYGMNYNSGYPYQQAYNPYLSGMGQLALTHSAVTSLPPLAPSENRFSGTAQPLGESDIMELLGTQNRQPASTTSAPTSAPTTSRPSDLSMADRMEVLYKEADFTDRGNCDTMVTQCNGDTEMALKMLKVQYLITLGLAKDTARARQALESRQYDLTAAANLLLG